MKRIISLLCALCVVIEACAQSIEQESSSPTLRKVDRMAERMKKLILSSKTMVKPSGAIYYVSSEGDDANDGLSPEKPIRTIERVNALALKPSDGVMFRRGDMFRGKIVAQKGVTYSAYGRGDKPRIYGSPCNAAKEGKWVEVAPNIYEYDMELADDVGTLVFNDGEQNAFKVLKLYHADGTTTNLFTGEPFSGGCDLKRDLDFFHDYRDAKRLWLCSTEGNPAERFSSIELNTRGNVINATDDVRVDNLCIKYGGSHGVGAGTVTSLVVTNCEIGWIGGSMLTPAPPEGGYDGRFGNGVEIYGGCEEFVVENCYIYQCYDAGITNQNQEDISDSSRTMRNVSFTHNLVELCEMPIEYYLGAQNKPTESFMENFLIESNILRQAGYGWGSQRYGHSWASHIKSWWMHYNQAYNFAIQDNIFDRSAANVVTVVAGKAEWLPEMKNNTYIQYLGGDGGRIGQPWADYKFDADFPTAVEKVLGEKNGKFILIER